MTRDNDDIYVIPGARIPESKSPIEPIMITDYKQNAHAKSAAHVDELSIYDIRSNARRKVILFVVSSMAVLLPFCDTIYLPALVTIEKDLQTNATLVAISVSIYLFMNGLFGLAWGPLSDRYGRKRTLLVALAFFIGMSIVCIFAPNIIVLIVFRALQGAAVSATLVIGQGIIADIYPPERRGWYTGIFFVPFLLGPVIGPLVGGALSTKFGWRSTFVLLTIFSFVLLLSILILLPETQQYFAMRRFERQYPEKRIQYDQRREKPHFQKPWLPLKFLGDMAIAPYIAVATTTFTSLFVCATLFGIYLGEEPYRNGATIIGVLFVPSGVAMLVGSLLGGWLSDKAGRYFTPNCPEGRLVPAIAFSLFTPIGLLIFGWSFHYRVNVAGGIIGQIILSFGQSVYQPGVFAYLTAKKQKDAAAASAANSVLNFCGAGLGVTIAVPLDDVIGIGPFFSILSGINFVAILIGSLLLFRCIRYNRNRNLIEPEIKHLPNLPLPTIALETVQDTDGSECIEKSYQRSDSTETVTPYTRF